MTRQRGFSLVEAMVGLVVGSLVLAAAYSLWSTHQTEGMRLSKKTDLRNKLTLASKRIQRSVTLAGFGMGGAATLEKQTGFGSDTLIVYTNMDQARTTLAAAYDHHDAAITVANPGPFDTASFVAIVGPAGKEVRRLSGVSGSVLHLDSAFSSDFPIDGTSVLPVARERFYSDQDSLWLVHEQGGEARVIATDVRNFQFSFTDKRGQATTESAKIKTVRYSLTGVFPAAEGAINTLVLSSTAIPRNTL